MIPKGKINQGSRLSLTSQNRIRSKIEEEENSGVQNNEQSHFRVVSQCQYRFKSSFCSAASLN